MVEQLFFRYAKELGQKSSTYLLDAYLSFALKLPQLINMEENRQQMLKRMMLVQVMLYVVILFFVWFAWFAFNDLEANNLIRRSTHVERFLYSLIFTVLYTISSIWVLRVTRKTHQLRSQAIDKKFQTVEEASQLREQFMANMSHEIRTPLNAIIGFTNVLTRTNLQPAQQELTNNIQTSSETLLNIVNDILDFSKIEAGMLVLEKTPFDLPSLLHSVQQMFREKARAKDLSLDFDLAPGLAQQVQGDPTRVTQIFVNLLSNAIKFTQRGGVLVHATILETTANRVRIQVEVRDTGIGIPRDQIERIFERFTQSDEQTTRLYGGTGLGLPIVKQLAEAMQGSISVKSEPGFGSMFTLVLPFELAAVENRIEAPKVADEKTMDFSHLQLLVAEDNPMNRRVVELLFEEWGFQYSMVHNGREAVELLCENPERFDLVFMDIQMPEMDGYEATRQIRQELGLNVPIVAMTAHALAGEREKCIRLGMNDYIAKPFREAEFRQIVTRFAPKITVSVALELDREYLQETTLGNATYQRELAQIFLAQTPKDLDAIHAALHANDLSAAAKAAHNMKSTVGYMGFAKNIGQQLSAFEEACEQGKNLLELHSHLQQINSMVEQARGVVEKEFIH